MATTSLSQFFIPEQYPEAPFDFFAVRTAVIVPTYKPGVLTAQLIRDLTTWNPEVEVYVVDDCTPKSYLEGKEIFSRIRSFGDRVTLLKTPVNALKAGALNFALEHIWRKPLKKQPHVIVTLDDDVVLTRTTIRNLVVELMKNPTVGATCSQCGVLNKDTNLLTRLQGLEYAGFNATRLADQGFFGGPLVMHGMLTAFRAHALKEVRGFTEKHLIEDYEITTRLKEAGWRVKSAAHAYALTQVPETLAELWRQRTRWSYGGMMVMAHARSTGPVIQDVLGHAVFVATILLIDIMIFSPKGTMVPEIGKALMAIALLQLSLWYGFQLWLMRFYRERDRLDWVIRLSLIPEFIYSNILTLVLVGSYLFFAFNLLASRVTDTSGTILWWMVRKTRGVFLDFGYTEGWGTRTQS